MTMLAQAPPYRSTHGRGYSSTEMSLLVRLPIAVKPHDHKPLEEEGVCLVYGLQSPSRGTQVRK